MNERFQHRSPRKVTVAALEPAIFRARLKDLDLSHAALGRRLGKNAHTVGKWANGTTPVPPYVAYVLDLLDAIRIAEKNLADARNNG